MQYDAIARREAAQDLCIRAIELTGFDVTELGATVVGDEHGPILTIAKQCGQRRL